MPRINQEKAVADNVSRFHRRVDFQAQPNRLNRIKPVWNMMNAAFKNSYITSTVEFIRRVNLDKSRLICSAKACPCRLAYKSMPLQIMSSPLLFLRENLIHHFPVNPHRIFAPQHNPNQLY